MTTIIGGKLMQIDKSAFRNVVRHTDTHNRIKEIDEMWKQHGKLQSAEESDEEYEKRDHRRKRSAKSEFQGRLYSDAVGGRRERDKPSKAGVWTKKLMEFEEKDPDRWGHSGFKELYPEGFDDSGEKTFSKGDEEVQVKGENDEEEDIVQKWKKGRFRPKVETRRPMRGFDRGRGRRRIGRVGGFGGSFRRDFSDARQRQGRFERDQRERRRSKSYDRDEPTRTKLPGRFDRHRSRSESQEKSLKRDDDEDKRKELRTRRKFGTNKSNDPPGNKDQKVEARRGKSSDFESRYRRERERSGSKEKSGDGFVKEEKETKDTVIEVKEEKVEDRRGIRRQRWDQREKTKDMPDDKYKEIKNKSSGEDGLVKPVGKAEIVKGQIIRGRWDESDSNDESEEKDYRIKGDAEVKNFGLDAIKGNFDGSPDKASLEFKNGQVDMFGRDISKRFEYIGKKKSNDVLRQVEEKDVMIKEEQNSMLSTEHIVDQGNATAESKGFEKVAVGDMEDGSAKDKSSDSEVEGNRETKGKSKKNRKQRKKEKKKKKHKKRKDREVRKSVAEANIGDGNSIEDSADGGRVEKETKPQISFSEEDGISETEGNHGQSIDSSGLNVEAEIRERIRLKMNHRMASLKSKNVLSFEGRAGDRRKDQDSNDETRVERDHVKINKKEKSHKSIDRERPFGSTEDHYEVVKNKYLQRREEKLINSFEDEVKTKRDRKLSKERYASSESSDESMKEKKRRESGRSRKKSHEYKGRKRHDRSSDSSNSEDDRKKKRNSSLDGHRDSNRPSSLAAEKEDRHGKGSGSKTEKKMTKSSDSSENTASSDDEVYGKANARKRGGKILAGRGNELQKSRKRDQSSSADGENQKKDHKAVEKTKRKAYSADSSRDLQGKERKRRKEHDRRSKQTNDSSDSLASSAVESGDDLESYQRNMKKQHRKDDDVSRKGPRRSMEFESRAYRSLERSSNKGVDKDKDMRKGRNYTEYSSGGEKSEELNRYTRKERKVKKERNTKGKKESSDDSTDYDVGHSDSKKACRDKRKKIKERKDVAGRKRSVYMEDSEEETDNETIETKSTKKDRKDMASGKKREKAKKMSTSDESDNEKTRKKCRDKKRYSENADESKTDGYKGKSRDGLRYNQNYYQEALKSGQSDHHIKEDRDSDEFVQGSRDALLKDSLEGYNSKDIVKSSLQVVSKRDSIERDFDNNRRASRKTDAEEIHAFEGKEDEFCVASPAAVGRAQTRNVERKLERSKVGRSSRKDKGDGSSSDFSLYGDIDVETITKKSKMENVIRDNIGVEKDRDHYSEQRQRERANVSESPSDDETKGRQAYRMGAKKGGKDYSKYSDEDRKSTRKSGHGKRSSNRRRSSSSERGKSRRSSRKSRERSASRRRRRRSLSSSSNSKSDGPSRGQKRSRSSTRGKRDKQGSTGRRQRSTSGSSWSSASRTEDRRSKGRTSSKKQKDRKREKSGKTHSWNFRRPSESSNSSSEVDRKKRRK